MKRKKYICTIYLFLILSTTLFGFILISTTSYQNEELKSVDDKIENLNNEFKGESKPKISNNGKIPLSNSNITQNATSIHRLFQSIEFVVNVSEFVDQGANKTIMQISFTNNSVVDYTMNYADGTNMNFTYIYTPEYNAPLGQQKVNFLIYNKTGWLLNTNTTYRYFTILSNYMSNISADTEYYRGDTLVAELIVTNISDHIFTWNITVVNSTNENSQSNLFDIGNNLNRFSFNIDERFEQLNVYYYIKLNMTRHSNSVTKAAYFQFKILNHPPYIIPSSIEFSPTKIYRTESCSVILEVSDADSDLDDISVEMILEDPDGDTDEFDLEYHLDSFHESFEVDEDKPAGLYRVEFNALDEYGGSYTYETELTVKNNDPEINSFEVNGHSLDESISVLYGEDLVFNEFDIEDVEGIAYLKIALINEENEWYNVTRDIDEDEEDVEDIEIIIRTVDLMTGIWKVYVYVTDTDGETVGLGSDYDNAPQEITIVSDLISEVFMWIVLSIGLGIGCIAGIGLGYYIAKSKRREPIVIKEKEAPPKKPVKRKKPAKPKVTPPKKKPIKKEIVEEKPVERKPRKKRPPRKIKRTLE